MENDSITVKHLIGGYGPFAIGLFTWVAGPTIAAATQPSQGWMMFVTFSSIVGGIAISVATEKIMEYIGWR